MPEPRDNPITAFIKAGPTQPVDLERAAVLIVDMQYHDAHREFGIGRRAQERGDAEKWTYYWNRLAEIVPRQHAVLAAARRRGVEVIYSTISALTRDCREIGPEYERAGVRVPPGSKEAEILAELKPEPDDIVLRKSTSSVFNSTTLDRILRNLHVDTLIVAGVLTRGCIESTVRDGADLGYRVILIEDACGDLTAQRHEEALRGMSGSFAEVALTETVVGMLSSEAIAGRQTR